VNPNESDFSTATPSANSSRSGVVVVIRHVLLTISTDVIVIGCHWIVVHAKQFLGSC
jgi:hypothetical protein